MQRWHISIPLQVTDYASPLGSAKRVWALSSASFLHADPGKLQLVSAQWWQSYKFGKGGDLSELQHAVQAQAGAGLRIQHRTMQVRIRLHPTGQL